MLNDIKVMGRLTKDPELRQTPNGTAVAGFTLAVDRDYRDQQGNRPTDFFDIVCWKGTAELASKYLTKGRLIVVSGRLETRDYNDKNGNKRRAYEIICQNFYFGDSAKGQQSQQHPPQQEPAQPQYKQPTAFDNLGTQVPFDEEVPF